MRSAASRGRAATAAARQDRSLLGIFLLALFIRIALVWRANGRQANGPARLFGDSIGYDGVALGLFEGDYFSYPARVPGYSVFLAGLHLITGHDYDWMLYLQAAVGALAVIPTFLIGQRVFSDRVGRLAALGVALHWGLANESTIFFSEVLYTPVLLCAVFLLLRVLDDASWKDAVAGGVLMAVATLIRPTTVGFGVALLAIAVVQLGAGRGLRLTLAFVAGMLALLAPWSIRNLVVHDTYLLSSSVAVLYYGSPLGHDWIVEDGRDFYGNTEGTGVWDVELNPARNGGHDPHLIEGDRHLTSIGIEAIRERPITAARFSVIKAGWLWVGGPFDWYGGGYFDVIAFSRIWSWWEAIWIILSRVVFVPALVAAVVLRRSWRRLLPLYGVIGYFTLFHALTWSELRYSEPLVPLLFVIVAAGVEQLRTGGPADQLAVQRCGGPSGPTERRPRTSSGQPRQM